MKDSRRRWPRSASGRAATVTPAIWPGEGPAEVRVHRLCELITESDRRGAAQRRQQRRTPRRKATRSRSSSSALLSMQSQAARSATRGRITTPAAACGSKTPRSRPTGSSRTSAPSSPARCAQARRRSPPSMPRRRVRSLAITPRRTCFTKRFARRSESRSCRRAPGSGPDHTTFDIPLNRAVTKDELASINRRVMEKVREALPFHESQMPYKEAVAAGRHAPLRGEVRRRRPSRVLRRLDVRALRRHAREEHRGRRHGGDRLRTEHRLRPAPHRHGGRARPPTSSCGETAICSPSLRARSTSLPNSCPNGSGVASAAQGSRERARQASRPGPNRSGLGRRRRGAVKHGRVDFVTETVDASNLDELKAYADRYLEIVKSGIVTVVGGGMFVIKVSSDLVPEYDATRLKALFGTGGGRPQLVSGKLTVAPDEAFNASKRLCVEQVQVPAQAQRLLQALHGARHRHRPHQGPGGAPRRRRRRGPGRRTRASGARRHVRRGHRRPEVGDPVIQPRARGGRGHGQDGPGPGHRRHRRRADQRLFVDHRLPARELEVASQVQRDLDDAADGAAPRAPRGPAPARARAQLRPARSPPRALLDHEREGRRLPGHQPCRLHRARTSRSPSSTRSPR